MTFSNNLHSILPSKAKWLLCLLLLCASYTALAEDTGSKEDSNFIFHHISDAHEWHLVTVGNTHITIPLPIVLVSQSKGIEVFSSNRFWDAHHQQRVSYRGYYLNDHEKIISASPAHSFYDLSITKNVASIMLSIIVLIPIALVALRKYRGNPFHIPRGFWALIEMLICFVRDDIAIPNIGKHSYKRFTPYLLSIFFFIWLNNLMGLLPGAANVTGNISVTLTLALFTLAITFYNANKNYWRHIFCPPGIPMWLLPIMIPVEIIGVFTKPIALMVRLFANITAGHIILLSIISLVFIFQTSFAGLMSVPFGAFMFMLKLLVAFLQAYIFTLLSAIYFGMAVEKAHH